MGGGCQRHPQYMQMFCARTCELCDAPENELQVGEVSLAGSVVKTLSAKGVRRWKFLELPVLSVEHLDSCSQASSNVDQCQSHQPEKRTHVVAANYYDGGSHALNSTVYRWSPADGSFVPHQMLPTVGAYGLSSFELRGEHYLCVASFYDGTIRKLNSTVYRWSAADDLFLVHQELATDGARDVEFMEFSDELRQYSVLAFAGSADDSNENSGECRTFLWQPQSQRFELLQVLASAGAYDVESLGASVPNEEAFAVVHEHGADVYKLIMIDDIPSFSLSQRLIVQYGRDAEHVILAGQHYLILSVFRGESSYEADSIVYVKDASHRFVEAQRLRGEGTVDAELISGGDLTQPLLLVASQRSGKCELYSFGQDQIFHSAGSFRVSSVYNFAWHFISEAQQIYLGLAKFWD